MKKRILTMSMLALSCMSGMAQWATQPSENLCWKSVESKLTYPGELAVDPRTGFTYATMERNERLPGDEETDTSLPVYLQIFNPEGVPVLADGGMMVTEIQTKSYSTGYALLVADNGDALVAYTDVRHNGSSEIYLYRITKEGKHLWFDDEGNPGKRLTANETQEMRMRMVKFDNDKYVIAWSDPELVQFTVIDEHGDMLDKYPTELSPGSISPVLLATEDKGFIISYAQLQADGKHQLMVEKYDNNQQRIWQQVYAYSGVSAVTRYRMVSDGKSGVVLAWSWGVNLGEAFVSVQHIKADGTKVIADNTLTDTNSNFQHDYPVLDYDVEKDEIVVAWRKRRKTPLATLWDKMVVRRYVGGQPLTGTTDNEIKLFEDGASYSHWPANLTLAENGDVIFTYRKSVSSSNTDEIITRRFTRSLSECWFSQISGRPTSKSLSREVVSHKEQIVMQWLEEETDSGFTSMRIQNIGFDGVLGKPMATSLEQTNSVVNYAVYPTFVKDKLHVSFELKQREHVDITLYNMFGSSLRNLFSKELDASLFEECFATDGLNPGVYLLEVKTGAVRHTQRIVVE